MTQRHHNAVPEHNRALMWSARLEHLRARMKSPPALVVEGKKGHEVDTSALAFKTEDKLQAAIHAETTDKIIVASTGGRFYTLAADKLPGGRGHGEPIRLMVDMDAAEDVVSVFVHDPERKLLVASNEGRGFIVPEADILANTRKGKQVMTVSAPEEMRVCIEAAGDMVATLGENRKLLIFALSEVPEMNRGKGVRLQKYKDGGIADARVFKKSEGLTWQDSSGRSFVRETKELKDWIGTRAQAGRLPPQGFPRHGKFG